MLSLSSKIFAIWYCKKLQNLLYFQSQVIFVSFQDCHQSTVEIRQGGAEKNTFLLKNVNPYLGLFNRKKTSQWPCRFLFQLSNCLSGKILFRFSTLWRSALRCYSDEWILCIKSQKSDQALTHRIIGCVKKNYSIYKEHMTHSQMLGKIEYTLPAKFWRLVGCTEMLSW